MSEMDSRKSVVLLVETSNSYGRQLLRGIHDWMLENERWSIRFLEQGRGANVPGWLEGWDGDGIIARLENTETANCLMSLGIPLVDVSAALPESNVPRVATDSRRVVEIAIAHFRERGLRRFAFCGDRRFLWSNARERYFEEHLERHALEGRLFPGQPNTPEREMKELGRWLKSLIFPVGVLACYDLRAQQLLEACREMGIKVPEEVAVLGVHNDELLCDLCHPPLSSVEPNARRAGYVASGILAEMMEGKWRGEKLQLIEPFGVVTRQSTDLVAVDDSALSAALHFIREHACEGINVSDVLGHVPMARTSLEKRFKSILGKTPRQHIEEVRLEQVKKLLVSTSISIGQIALQVGYPHAEYLTVAFSRSVGYSPLKFRKIFRLNEKADI